MDLLDKLWDDTLAGPQPDLGPLAGPKPDAAGLGRLRKKHPTFPFSRSSAAKGESEHLLLPEEATPKVTRSIMIKRPSGCPSPGSTPPASPAGSTPPVSPFSGSGPREWNRLRRKSSSDAYERGVGVVHPPSPHEV